MRKGFASKISKKLPMLKRYARSLTGNAHDSEDLVQDCVERSLTRANQFTEGTNLEAWLITIMRSIFINGKRHEKIVREHAKLAQKTLPRAAQPTQMTRLELREMARAYERLSEDHRTVLRLVAIEQRPHKEAAKILDIPAATAKTRLFRARERLQELMAA